MEMDALYAKKNNSNNHESTILKFGFRLFRTRRGTIVATASNSVVTLSYRKCKNRVLKL